MLNHDKKADNSAVYHSWINSILEAILHELDEKFEIAEEDRESTNFWIVTMAVLGLVMIVSMAVTITVLFTRMSRKQKRTDNFELGDFESCLLYTSPSPRDATLSRMPSSA